MIYSAYKCCIVASPAGVALLNECMLLEISHLAQRPEAFAVIPRLLDRWLVAVGPGCVRMLCKPAAQRAGAHLLHAVITATQNPALPPA